jgi:hypothetical protein
MFVWFYSAISEYGEYIMAPGHPGLYRKVAIYEILVLRAEAPWGIYKYPQF